MSSNDPGIAFAPTRGTGAGRTPSVGADVQGALFPETQPGRTSDVARAKGSTVTPLRAELVAWRQQVIYVGTLSADTEIGLGSPPVSGALLRKVSFRVRSDLALGAEYWTVEARWRDLDLTPMALGSLTTDTTMLTAHIEYPVYHVGSGLRLEEQHEATVSFSKTGSPGNLVQVTLYADWYVGV